MAESTSNKSIKNFEKDLREILEKMNNNQTGKFLTIFALRNIVYLSNDFLNNIDKEEKYYLNMLLISIGINYVLFFNLVSDLAIARLLASDISRDLAVVRTFKNKFISGFILDRDVARNIAIALNRAISREPSKNLKHVIVGELKRTLDDDLKLIIIEDAKTILSNNNNFIKNSFCVFNYN